LSTPTPAILVLGASSGFGEATVRAFAAAGYDVFGVHLDRAAGLAHVAEIVAAVEAHGRRARFFNVNAADAGKRAEVVDQLRLEIPAGGLAVLLHSLAFGTLKPLVTDDEKEALNQRQLEMTLDVMANSLVYWTQDLVRAGLLGRGLPRHPPAALAAAAVGTTALAHAVFFGAGRYSMVTFAILSALAGTALRGPLAAPGAAPARPDRGG